ncbi:hypothetical protein ACVWW3_006145 [Bradyrhizobium sp. LM2.9]
MIGAIAVLLEPEREVHHVLVGRAGMRRDEIRDQVTFLAGLFGRGIEHPLELVVGADARLHHHARC